MKHWWILLLVLLGILLAAGVITAAVLNCRHASAQTYPVDYGTQAGMYTNAQPAYPAGASVVLCMELIATDTDYTFLLDGEEIQYDYDDSKGFLVSFTMPDHPVKLECVMKNSMLYDPDA